MNHLHSLVLAITLLVGGVSVATAQDFNKGFEAAQSGDFETALQEWRPLAEQGNAPAQYNLGVAYRTARHGRHCRARTAALIGQRNNLHGRPGRT